MLKGEEELLKKLTIEDLERVSAYGKDLTMGLQIIRSFPQGVTVFGSARLPQDNKYCKKAYELGRLLAENGHTVTSGGGPGIMGAASHGAYEIGGRTIGLNIKLMHEQVPNPYLTDCVTFQYFFARKVALAMASKVFVFFPGSYGTLDEMFEILCLMKEDKMPTMPIFCVGKDFWKAFDPMTRKILNMGMADKSEVKLIKYTDDLMEIVKAANKIGHPKISENFYDGFKEASALGAK